MYICICKCICVYIYIYLYVYLYIHIWQRPRYPQPHSPAAASTRAQVQREYREGSVQRESLHFGCKTVANTILVWRSLPDSNLSAKRQDPFCTEPLSIPWKAPLRSVRAARAGLAVAVLAPSRVAAVAAAAAAVAPGGKGGNRSWYITHMGGKFK